MISATDLPARLALPNYSAVEVLYRGHRKTVYRAVEKATQQLVTIKVLSQASPSFDDLVQFRNQYTVTKDLPVSGIVHPVDLVPCGNGYALVMENFEGIDFSIASLLPTETQVIQSAKNLEGSLAYLAPEQTGCMNRTVDYRTDFYSLGATLYELLTGQLPFTSDDPLALIHCHIFTTPERSLVIFIDDLQWADSASLNLIRELMAKGRSQTIRSPVVKPAST